MNDHYRPALPLEDFIPLILEHLTRDYPTLYRCTLVDHTFNHFASAILYRRVIFVPPPTNGLNLAEKFYLNPSLINSAYLTHNSKYVRELEVGGYLVGRTLTKALAHKFREAFPSWINLTSVALHPCQFRQELFTDVLKALRDHSHLRHLAVNSSCMDEVSASLLVQISGLATLSLSDPTRAILDLLIDWLSRLSPTLKGFHLKGNCGSITPGVLRSLVSFLGKIHSFSLGLSYSLEDAQVFDFLCHLPEVHNLELRYYWQMKQPPTVPKYTRLRYFTVRHNYMDTRDEAIRLRKWIRRIISHSPIESLELVCDSTWDLRGPHPSFDDIVNHLIAKHPTTLRMLRMDHVFVGADAVRRLCSECDQIEELVIGVGVDTLNDFPQWSKLMTKLRSVTLRVCHVKKQMLLQLFDDGKAQEFFENGSPTLRVLQINTRRWEGNWKTIDRDVQFLVEPMKTQEDALEWKA